MTKKEMKAELNGIGLLELKEIYTNNLNAYNSYKNNLKNDAKELAELDINDSNYGYKASNLIANIQWFKSIIKENETWFEIANAILREKESEVLDQTEYEKYMGENKVNIKPILMEVEKMKERIIQNNTDTNISEEMIIESIEIMTKEVIYILKDKIGNITEVVRLALNNNRGFDGLFKGDKGSINISTILAGGYNIQRLHYRTLVTKCNK